MNDTDKIKFGEDALRFKNSEHWAFFLRLCGVVRDDNLTGGGDATAQLQSHACAVLMNEIPARVDEAIRDRENILKAAERKGSVVEKVVGGMRRAFSTPNPS